MKSLWLSSGAVPNRTYRAWEKLGLPIYFFKLHQTAPTGSGAGDIFLKLTLMVRLGNREEIRRNTQKHPIKYPKQGETPYQKHPKQKPYRVWGENLIEKWTIECPCAYLLNNLTFCGVYVIL